MSGRSHPAADITDLYSAGTEPLVFFRVSTGWDFRTARTCHLEDGTKTLKECSIAGSGFHPAQVDGDGFSGTGEARGQTPFAIANAFAVEIHFRTKI
jgi:hypothetical protein